jgi:hypothetical protein
LELPPETETANCQLFNFQLTSIAHVGPPTISLNLTPTWLYLPVFPPNLHVAKSQDHQITRSPDTCHTVGSGFPEHLPHFRAQPSPKQMARGGNGELRQIHHGVARRQRADQPAADLSEMRVARHQLRREAADRE